MKLKEFIENLNEFVKENPEALELDVYTSKDDEGNGHNSVVCEPVLGNFEDGVFSSVEQIEDAGWEDVELNAVCIN
jgi:hypothetical protein